MSGPAAPQAQAFRMCGWRTCPVDILLDYRQDISFTKFQSFLHQLLDRTDFISAALGCSTKSRAREIPR
eukprot:10795682-Karenia_brevis.AAC.1